jgi:putative ABC transport system ATP-binding protein
MRLVLAACRRGVAAVVVTHDAQLASWADRVVFIRDGQIVDQTSQADTLDELLARGEHR